MLFATGLMTRRHMSLEECLSHISKGRAEFCNSLIRPALKGNRKFVSILVISLTRCQ